ncbi:unnamed protein product [Cyprideis torosa]|uniref:Uncharacterized protein n=1 Tax=Cyprideis torosa TaxID=163714 RepID=A0A7R8WN71_9CRUS|nr:unnamed protein product [Cyprideis torosa]CAG0900273.1 unnamed protein product [Cyprideis torosa]
MKTIGLLGGMSWESTREYYRILNEEIRNICGSTHSARCLLYSFDFHEIEALQNAGDWQKLTDMLVNQALNLKKAGADFIVICTNTMHLMAETIERETGLFLLHIADVTGEKIRSTGMRRVALLATAFTMEMPFYKKRLTERYGIEVLVPEEEERQVIHRIIYDELVQASLGQAGPVVIKIAHPNVPQHPMGKCFIQFKNLVEERSKGKFRVDIYDSSKFGNFDSVVQGLQYGILQMGSASTPNLSPFSDSFLIYDLPFLFPDYASTDLITDGPIGMEAAEALKSSGIIGLGYIEIGFRNIWNNKKTIQSLEDAKGLKIRSTPSKAHIATLKALGMNPTPISWGEVYTALQQKTVDGIDIDLNLAWYNNFPEVNNNLTIVNSLYSPHLVMMSKKFLDSLSGDDQKMLLDTFQEVKLYERKLIREGEEEILAKLKEKGVNVTVLSREERARWARETASVYEQFEDRIGKELIEKVRKTISQQN